MGCCECCKTNATELKNWHQILRWLMFISNFLIFCGAAFMLSYAIYMIDSKWTLLAHDDNIIPVIMFISFSVILLVTTLGSLGACHLSKVLLYLYTCITIVCLILELTLIGLIASSNFDKDKFLERRWKDLSNSDMEWLQDEFNCCGYNSEVAGYNCNESTITTTYSPLPYCEKKLKNYVSNVEDIALGLGITTFILQIFGSIVAIILIRAIKKAGNRVRDDSYVEYSYYDQL